MHICLIHPLFSTLVILAALLHAVHRYSTSCEYCCAPATASIGPCEKAGISKDVKGVKRAGTPPTNITV